MRVRGLSPVGKATFRHQWNIPFSSDCREALIGIDSVYYSHSDQSPNRPQVLLSRKTDSSRQPNFSYFINKSFKCLFKCLFHKSSKFLRLHPFQQPVAYVRVFWLFPARPPPGAIPFWMVTIFLQLLLYADNVKQINHEIT